MTRRRKLLEIVAVAAGRAQLARWMGDALKREGTLDPTLAMNVGDVLILALPEPRTKRDAQVCVELAASAARGVYEYMQEAK